ncbi:hypothetical protein BKA61DRAFT_276567 [Leptodontidium sp. MPI-SDFR-AT-0119]|nr:hypothetical protein BKA61DRAFT_276567 [Leptodontidium sp. MPI-SDFR-AT-0119]
MDLIQSASSALSWILSSSSKPQDTKPSYPPLETFHQFPELPVELRLKIWGYTAPLRTVRVHLHDFSPSMVGGSRSSGPRFIQGPVEQRPDLPIYNSMDTEPHHMIITLCSPSRDCGCDMFPPKTRNLLPLPGVLLACHESRDVLLKEYRRCLEDEYDLWGQAVANPTSRMQKSLPSEPPVTGLIVNPSADIIHLSVNVSSCNSVVQLNRFAGIAAQQLPDLQRIVLNVHIAMPPYKFWATGRFQFWKNWGGSGWWVPARYLVKMQYLKEVILIVKKSERMLPVEWRNRTEGQWVEELWKLEDQWPAGWEGRMPRLKFVQSIEEIWMPSW